MKKSKRASSARQSRSSRRVRPARAHRAGRATAAPAGRSRPFALDAECTIAGTASLKTGLARLLKNPGTVRLDASAVRRIDTAGLQVLASFVRERAARGAAVEWLGVTPALTEAAELLGLSSTLGLPPAAAKQC